MILCHQLYCLSELNFKKMTASYVNYAGSEQVVHSKKHPPGSKPIVRPVALTKAKRFGYLMWAVPDLDKQQGFLEDFGMLTVSKTADNLTMRSYGDLPYVYTATKSTSGQAEFIGLSLIVESVSELQKLADEHGQPIEKLDRPGGGSVVRLVDPNGVQVEACCDIELVEKIDTRLDLLPRNAPEEKVRVNGGLRTEPTPAPVLKLGHCVMGVSEFEPVAQWYMGNFGLIPSDVQCFMDGSPGVAFFRFDLGDTPADHHAVVLIAGGQTKYMHSAYEVVDLEAVGQGQQFLKLKQHKHFWGMGRHILGSQIFDYWLDPNGQEFEHYADGDVFTADHPENYYTLDLGSLFAWGDDLPPSMRKVSPKQGLKILLALISGKMNKKLLGNLKQAMGRKPRPWN